MKEIKLTQGQVAIINDEDFDLIQNYSWIAQYVKHRNVYYAVTALPVVNGKQPAISMHRLIMGAPKGVLVDHKNRNTLDNRKENLRLCNTFESARNKGVSKRNSTGLKGVSFCPSRNKYQALIGYNNKLIFLGRFDTAEQASMAYETKAQELHGEFYHKNFV